MLSKKLAMALILFFSYQLQADSQHIYNQKYIAKLLKRIPKDQKFIALTFDDGPCKLTTPSIVKILDKYKVKATFFMLGQQAYTNNFLVESIVEAGHEIGNHTYSHAVLTKRSLNTVTSELKKTQNILLKYSENIHWFRPPYGVYNSQIHDRASELGLYTVLWSVDSRDWKKCSTPVLIQRVLRDIQPGSIVLFHDTKANTVEALPQIIEALQNDGYEFLTMTEWLTRIEKFTTPASQQNSKDVVASNTTIPTLPTAVEHSSALTMAVSLKRELSGVSPLN